MKRTTIHISAALALLLGIAACTQDELADSNRLPEGKYPVVIHATGLSVEATPQAAPLTRASVDGDWQDITSVALKMGDEVKEYTVTATDADGYKSATLSRENDPHYWTSRDPITVSAWWPIDNADITQMPAVKVAADQSKLDSFAASDFIAAIDHKVEFDEPKLTFEHRTALVTVVLTDYTEERMFVWLTGLSTENGNPAVIAPYKKDNDTWSALVAPQSVAAGTDFIFCTFDNGKTFAYRMQEAAEWQAGEEYTYTVSLAAAMPDYTVSDDGKTYTVYTADGLLEWNRAVQNDMTLNCILARDIDLTGKEWIIVGTNSNSYTGTFDGGGHTVTGLVLDKPGENKVAMFGRIANGTVKDLKLAGLKFSGYEYVAGIVGFLDSGTVSGCSVSGELTGYTYVAGIVGSGFECTIDNCSSDGSVTASDMFAGGIAGASVWTSISECRSSAAVQGQYSVGGIVGYCNENVITACCATGAVTAPKPDSSRDELKVGGIVGINESSLIVACYSTSDVSAQGSYVGGIAGFHVNEAIACYHSGTVNGTGEAVGGIVGYNYKSDNFAGSASHCYWNGTVSTGRGIGDDQPGTGGATQVDGTTVTWLTAVDAMNAAIGEWNANNPDRQCNWRYELTGELPALKKQ